MKVSKLRGTQWLSETASSTVLTAAGGTLSSVSLVEYPSTDFIGNAEDYQSPTLVRIVGNLYVQVHAATAVFARAIVHYGVIRVPEFETPASFNPVSNEDRGWIWWGMRGVFSGQVHEAANATDMSVGVLNVPFDIRVGRKLERSHNITFVIVPDGAQIKWCVSARVLMAQ